MSGDIPPGWVKVHVLVWEKDGKAGGEVSDGRVSDLVSIECVADDLWRTKGGKAAVVTLLVKLVALEGEAAAALANAR